MREILFRGKTNHGEWVYGSLILAGEYCCILQSEEDVRPVEYPFLEPELGIIDGYATPVIPETVGQYTGITDKKGKKIFEGDVVKYSIYGLARNSIKVKFGEVIFSDQCFMPLTFAIPGSIEILTNIHDDPVRAKYLNEASELL